MRRSVLALRMALILAGPARGQNNEEFRASWVVDTQWLSPENSVNENQALIRQILDNHIAGNFTSVIWQVRRFGTVYYPSAIEPWGPRTGLANPGFDPLGFALEEAHARGLEFHAWLNVFESRNVFPGSPSQVNPDWVCRDRAGLRMPNEIAWLSPGLTEVRRYLVNLAMEVVNAYDIDGIHMDFIRWNEHTNSALSSNLAKRNLGDNLPDGIITEAQLNELQSNTSGRFLYDVEHPFSAGVPVGFDTWEDWWRSSVTEFVRTLHDTIQTVKPWVRLSPAALGRYNWGGWQGFNVVYQDAALWLNERSIEQIVGMQYHWDLPQDFQSILVSGCPSCWSQFLQPAIQAGQLFTVGLFSDRFSEKRIFGRHTPIIDRVRGIAWVDGFQFFSYASWRDENYWNEGKSLFFNRKARIRATGLIENTAPDAPTLALTKIDSLQYEIGVTPAASGQDNHWFALYRSEDGNLNTSSDEIVDVHFGNSVYAFADTFSGTQDFNGTYTYFASTLDRFWNESDISNSAQSEAIPSFAPTVIASSPTANDSISVTSNVTVTFSKTMNIGTFANAVAFSPALSVSALSWTGDNKTLTIRTDESFEFSTGYTLTIPSTVADVNGRSLDGNADGLEGDAFLLAFKTFGQDLAGPRITFSFPDFETIETDFPVDEIITIVFDEILDASSVTSERISLRVGGVDVPSSHNLTTISDRSVLSIQPNTQSLDPDLDYAVTLAAEISDTLGNQLGSDFSVAFRTSIERTADVTLVEPFFSTTNWFQPNQSGSTVGIVVPNTRFEMSTAAFLPAVIPRQRISPALSYEWDESASSYLLRLFLQGGAPRDVLFDSTYVLQCYVFGDAGNNKFRFAVDDSTKDQAAFHEVSEWVTINWLGWRLVEWEMSDPNRFGIWLGDGVLNGPSLRFDSFQLTHEPGDATTGRIFFDNLRLVKKSSLPVNVENGSAEIPTDFALYQNYPNPFNPTTTISFDVPYKGRVTLRVYDTLGREVKTLIDEEREPGNHKIQFDADGAASGIYFYRLIFGNRSISRRMIIVK